MAAAPQVINEKESMVDPFLVEALQNPRHRLTILRMELDIQRFLQSHDQQQFEFRHLPTSYLRLAAHRVAQHYGLVTMVLDNGVDGAMNKILVKKTVERRCPLVCLSEIPAKEFGRCNPKNVKIAIRPRPNKDSIYDSKEFGEKMSHVRSMEERKEEYDKARARIFSNPGSPNSYDTVQADADGKSTSPCKEDNEISRNSVMDAERNIIRNGSSSRVAIFRDKEKDLTDPDYDRSYRRYVKSFSVNQSFGFAPLSMPKMQLPFVQYDANYPHMAHLPGTQASVSYRPAATPVMSHFGDMGSNQSLRGDAAYMQLPSPSMMYAHSYDQLRHAVFQAPFCQQPLSFDYSHHH